MNETKKLKETSIKLMKKAGWRIIAAEGNWEISWLYRGERIWKIVGTNQQIIAVAPRQPEEDPEEGWLKMQINLFSEGSERLAWELIRSTPEGQRIFRQQIAGSDRNPEIFIYSLSEVLGRTLDCIDKGGDRSKNLTAKVIS